MGKRVGEVKKKGLATAQGITDEGDRFLGIPASQGPLVRFRLHHLFVPHQGSARNFRMLLQKLHERRIRRRGLAHIRGVWDAEEPLEAVSRGQVLGLMS